MTTPRWRSIGGLPYYIFLLPISALGGIAVNYSSVALLFVSRFQARPKADVVLYLGFMWLSFMLGPLIYFRDTMENFEHLVLSFLVIFVPHLLLLIRWRMSRDDFFAIVAVACLLYSAVVIYGIAQSGLLRGDVLALKGGLRAYVPYWPQRYPPLLFFGLFYFVHKSGERSLSYLGAAICLAVLFVTFTRSAYLGLATGFGWYVLANLKSIRPSRVLIGKIAKGVLVLSAICLLLSQLHSAVPLGQFGAAGRTIWYSGVSAIQTTLAGGVHEFDPRGSEGTRVELFSLVMSTLAANPITGTGFAGVSLFGQGSAHSQYLDTLLRMGVVGLLFYLYFLGRAIIFYSKREPYIAAALVAMAVFGLFHETTKLPHLLLVFLFLVNKMNEESDVRVPRPYQPEGFRRPEFSAEVSRRAQA